MKCVNTYMCSTSHLDIEARSLKHSSHGKAKNITYSDFVFLSNGILPAKRMNLIIPYPTAFPYGNGMVLHFYQQQESSTT